MVHLILVIFITTVRSFKQLEIVEAEEATMRVITHRRRSQTSCWHDSRCLMRQKPSFDVEK